MKKVAVLTLLIISCTLFCSCIQDPDSLTPMSPDQICTYMNKEFGDYFKIVRSEQTDYGQNKTTTVYMNCSQLPGKTIVTTHGYHETMFGWKKVFDTNYNRLYFQDDIEKTYGDLMNDWFGTYEKKFSFSNPDTPESIQKYSSFQNYLSDTITYIIYNVVINARDEDIIKSVQEKVVSVSKDTRCKKPLCVRLYLWEDDASFQELSSSNVAELKWNDKYYYNYILENNDE